MMTSNHDCALQQARESLLLHFPNLAPGETFYSACARFHKVTSLKRSALTGQLLFDSVRAHDKRSVPVGLSKFVQAVGDVGDPLAIIEISTVGALYLRFMGSTKAARALSWCCKSSAGRERLAFGWGSSRFEQQHPLRLCPVCAKADVDLWGFPYWHLEHQLPGTFVCVSHGEPLRSLVPTTSGWKTPLLAETRQPEISWSKHHDLLWRLACTASSLCGRGQVNSDALRARICVELEQAGVVRAGGALNPDQVRRWLNSHLTNVCNCFDSFDAANTAVAICGVLGKRRAFHPLRWALLITCLVIEGASREVLIDAATSPIDESSCVALPPESMAPNRAYELLETGIQAKAAAAAAGVGKSVVARWLDDPVLRVRWRQARRQLLFAKHSAAVSDALLNGARSIADLRHQANAALQWFLRNDPQALNRQIADVNPEQQRCLWNGE